MLEPERLVALVFLVAGHQVGTHRSGCGEVIFTLQVSTDGIATDNRAGILWKLRDEPVYLFRSC